MVIFAVFLHLFYICFKIWSFNTIFCLPTYSWHKCGPMPFGTLLMDMVMGLIWQFQLFFSQKWSILTKNSTFWFKKMGQKGKKKSVPKVLDGNHGGLGRGWEGKNGLDAGECF